MMKEEEARCDYLQYEYISGKARQSHYPIAKITIIPSGKSFDCYVPLKSNQQVLDTNFYLDDNQNPTHGLTSISMYSKTGKPTTISLKIGATTLTWSFDVNYKLCYLLFNKTYESEITNLGILPLIDSRLVRQKLPQKKLPLVKSTLEELSLRTIDALVKKYESDPGNSKDQIGLVHGIFDLIDRHMERFSK
jgi:hypothetical protein